jgi:hypothetical protein
MVMLAGVAISLVPLAAFSFFLRSLVATGSLGILADRNVLTFTFAVFQAWGAYIAGAEISVASGIRVERSLLISLTLLYLTILVVFAQGLSYI